ncbi:iron-containing alcohol dehydrogenase, partial [Candidatus Sumerlaeota bacterium]|nr:iron-containing alcohol dehydrogenase [Candidatus Sumerlaeota bacterium]
METFKATVHGGWPIYFGEEARELLIEEIERLAPDRVFILTDRTVEELHAESIKENIPHAYQTEMIVFNEGEENKNLATLEHIAGDLLRAGATGRSLLLNLGGGVTLNIGGLAASLLGRGMRFIQIPTTFAAQWSVINTNRQAIHFVGGRNHLGVYRSPELALVDPYFLGTEPERQIVASLSEYAAAALTSGGAAFERAAKALSVPGFHLPPHQTATLLACIEHTLEAGRADPAEEKSHEWEAYGQTAGRALEILSDGKLLAGEARWYGMRIAGEIAAARGWLPQAEHRR